MTTRSNDKHNRKGEADTREDFLALEKRYWQALKDQDVETAVSLTDYPCILIGPQGVGSISRDAYEQMMRSASYTLDEFQLGDGAEVRMLRDDVAVVAYKVHEKLTVDGKPVELDAAESSTWIRRDGQWRCAQHSEALAGDPFGRDRSGGGKASKAPRANVS